MKIIKHSTTWAAGSVHNLKDDYQVAAGATLTIAPGAIVNGNDHTISIAGVLNAAGTSNGHVTLNDVQIEYLTQNGSTKIPDIRINYADVIDGGLLAANGSPVSANFSLKNSVVTGLGDSIGIWYPAGAVEVQHNVFLNSGGISAGVNTGASVAIEDNAFVNQVGPAIDIWADYNKAPVTIAGNNFLTTSGVDIELESAAANIDASQNWFGTTKKSLIEKMIIDGHDDLTLPTVHIGTPLSAPSTTAPLVAPDNGAARISGSPHADIIVGQGGDDVLAGHGGSDSLYGGDGNDRLHGDAGSDWIYGGAGADRLYGGTGSNTFIYHSASESTGKHHDVIIGFNAAADKLSLSASVQVIDSKVHNGTLDSAHFDHDLTAILTPARLSAHDAVLFEAKSGSLAGREYLVVDMNGVAGYQAGQDLVIELSQASHLSHLSLSTFV